MSERKEGLISFPAYEDLSDYEGYLVKLVNDSGTPKVARPTANTDVCPFVVRNGNTAGELVDLEPLTAWTQVQVKAKGTGSPGDAVILADIGTAADKGKVRAKTGNDPFVAHGIAEEAWVDGQMVKVRPVMYTSTLAQMIFDSLFDANTILYATVDNTPAALTVGEQTILGRITGGGIDALTGPEVRGVTDPITWTATAVAADVLAIPVTHRTVNKTSGADAEACTLADGSFLGQKLNVNLVTDGGGDATITPTTASGFTSVVLKDAGDYVELEWTTAGWRICGFGNALSMPQGATHKVVAAGIHDWAGGAATTDSIAVTGLLATDIVLATLVARGGTETLELAGNDADNDQIDLTLSANGTDGTTKVAYAVLRAH